MLKILFSPSEGKHSGGSVAAYELFGAKQARDEILNSYREIVLSGDEEAIKKLFGLKKFSECAPYIVDILNAPLMYAIERYDGVAYDYLKYQEQDARTQEYLKNNTIIFSNLYGPILGSRKLPTTK